MALESVTKEIEASANAKIAEIRKAQEAEIAAINAEAEAEIADMNEKQKKKVEEAVDALARQGRSSAELESKKIVLAKKKDVLNRAFEVALADLESQSAAEKLANYKAMVASAKKIIPAPKARMSAADKFTAAELGVQSVETDSKIKSGLILQSEDGKIEVDMQYSVLLQSIWDSNVKELSGILFR